MIMHEFGIEHEKTILLLHGAGCTYKMWTQQLLELQREYHVYAPSISGHEPGDIDFDSSRKEAARILLWFQQHDSKQIMLICGASLGAHVAAEMLQQCPSFAEYAMIESLKAYQYKGFMLKVFCTLGKLTLKKCAKTKGLMAGTYQQYDVSEDTKATILSMSNTSLNNIMIESGDYKIEEKPVQIQAITYLLCGSKEEKICRVNNEMIEKQIKDCKVIKLEGYHHGELAIGNPKRHLTILHELLMEK